MGKEEEGKEKGKMEKGEVMMTENQKDFLKHIGSALNEITKKVDEIESDCVYGGAYNKKKAEEEQEKMDQPEILDSSDEEFEKQFQFFQQNLEETPDEDLIELT